MEEKISVIIPIFNVEKYLNVCLESVINQTYRSLEIILVDDGSTDNCLKICEEYAKIDSRIIVIHQENGGQGKARNAGLNLARGNYIVFLDSDDFIDPNFIKILYKKSKEENADMVICNYNHVDEAGAEKEGGPKSNITQKEYTGIEAMKVALYWKEFGVAPWAKLYKRELWNNVRFKEDRIYEDLATTYLVYKNANKVLFYNKGLMSYRIRNNSDIHQSFNKKKIRILDSSDEILAFCASNVPEAIGAAESRALASASFILFRIPKEELSIYKDTVCRCENIIKKYRWNVLRDHDARRKTRLGALASYLGFRVERIFFDMFIS